MELNYAKEIFKENFVGPKELMSIGHQINFKLPKKTPNINIDLSSINPNDYILILGIKKLNDNSSLNLKKLVSIFGFKSSSNNVSFYNQDWYYKEKFTETCLSDKWYLVQKKVIDKTRGINPESLNDKDLPSSILCAYTFFSWWLLRKELLWKSDFIWCSDQDRHGDRIYVGKYMDLDDEKRSGFSIHRHLAIKSNYGCIKTL